jgi:SAM-dependent methyltransferase
MSPGWRQHLRRWHPEGIPWPLAILYNAVSRSRVFTEHYQLVADDVARFCPSGRVLDIGTGPGWLLLTLRRSLPEVDLIGVDISAAMVSLATANLDRAGCAGAVKVIQAGADGLPFRDESVDTVVSTGSVHHWKNPVVGLNEVHRVLKPGRYALLYDLVSHVPPAVMRKARAEFGRVRSRLLWLHSFEEPFYSPEDMEALAPATHFGRGETRFVGVLCCLMLKKGEALPAPTQRSQG